MFKLQEQPQQECKQHSSQDFSQHRSAQLISVLLQLLCCLFVATVLLWVAEQQHEEGG